MDKYADILLWLIVPLLMVFPFMTVELPLEMVTPLTTRFPLESGVTTAPSRVMAGEGIPT